MFDTIKGFEIQVIESIVIVVVYFVLRMLITKLVSSAANRFDYPKTRARIMRKLLNTILVIVLLMSLLFVWGVDQKDLAFFISSLITVLGVAFFAQWSIISNITTTIIIYINHPVKIGDRIEIMDKEFPVVGNIQEIGVFFMSIKMDDGHTVTIPSNLFVQKMVKKL